MNLKQYKKKWETRRFFGPSHLIEASQAAHQTAVAFDQLAKIIKRYTKGPIYLLTLGEKINQSDTISNNCEIVIKITKKRT